jgi:hypothetical protein
VEALPGVKQAVLASDHLRAIFAADVTDVAILQGLSAAGIQVTSIQPGAATMEDVFMTLSASN